MGGFKCQHTAKQDVDVAVTCILIGVRIATATILLCRLRSAVIYKVQQRHADDDCVACKAHPVWNHAEYEKAEACGKYDL